MKNANWIKTSVAVAIVTIGLMQHTVQAESLSANFGIIDRNGACGVALPFDGGKKLEINVRSKDGNVNIRLRNLPSELVRAGLKKENVPITLQFDTGNKVTTDVGYYAAGFYYEARGYWKNSADGAPALSAFKKAKNITVKVDGKSYGPVSTQAGSVNLAWGMIASCVKRNGGVMPGGDD